MGLLDRLRVRPPAQLQPHRGPEGEPRRAVDPVGGPRLLGRLGAGRGRPGAGPTAALSLGLNSPDLLLLSMDNGAGAASQLPMAGITVYRSVWITVEDPEGDGAYDVKIYTNGQTRPFTFGTATNAKLLGAG